MTNKAIAKPLKETAALIELTGGNPFRSRAFAGAARTIERLEQPVIDLIASGELTGIKGIGSGLASQIAEILDYGSFEVRDSLLGALPPGLLDVLAVKGLGAKKARALWQQLGVQSLDDLEAVARTGRIAELEGFAQKSQESILQNIALLRSFEGKRRYADAWLQAEVLRTALLNVAEIEEVWYTGELARGMNELSVLSMLVVGTPSSEALIDGVSLSEKTDSDGRRWSGSLEDGLSVDILCPHSGTSGRKMVEETGPAGFVEALRNRVGALPDADTEKEVFEKVGLPYIPAILRDLPTAADRLDELSALTLVSDSDLKGVLHNHSTYSDGAHTLREMSEAVRERGFSYFGICDHSQSLKIAHGMDVQTLLKQKEEIDLLNREFTSDGGSEFRVFFGVESDILTDGSLDYSDDVLNEFDFLVASVHVGFNMTEAQATDRVIKAISHPATRILGHPTGRLILKRDGYPLDHEAVLQACAAYGVAVELNASPYRLDLDWTWVERARQLGVLVSINPDAHSIDQLDVMKWGVVPARKGGLSANECLNALSLADFTTWIESGRGSRD